MKKLIIAEKHKLAVAVMQGIGGNFTKYDGFYESDNHIVTFTQGHLMRLFDVDDYIGQKQRWDMNILPYIPTQFMYQPIADKAGFKIKQYENIKSLIHRKDVDVIIHCGDPDREGELLVRLVLDQAKNSKPVYRMWCQSILPDVAKQAYDSMTPDSLYDNWANEGKARQYMDWLLGINITRLVSIKSGTLMRAGRVLVPIVKYVSDRDDAISSFVKQYSWAVEGTLTHDNQSFKLRTDELIFEHNNRIGADTICNKLNGTKVVVKDIARTSITKTPSKLFSGINLQMHLSKTVGIPPEDSLKAMQRLYEDGYISYPRTNTEYITMAEKPNIEKIIAMYTSLFPYLDLQPHSKKSVFDDSKCDGHTAITPTAKIPTDAQLHKFTDVELAVYTAVRNRFLANFCSRSTVIRQTKITLCADDYIYTLTGEKISEKGFTEIEPIRILKELPVFTKGQQFDVPFEVVEKESTPPKKVTISELLAYLKNPYKDVIREIDKKSESEYYEMLSNGCNLGTEATVTTILGNAVSCEYLSIAGKETLNIESKGKAFINALNKLQINLYREKNIDFNKMLRNVYKGTVSVDDCIAVVSNELKSIVSAAATIKLDAVANTAGTIIGKCPRCGNDVHDRAKGFSCGDQNCGFFIFKEDIFFTSKGKKVTASLIKKLLNDGQLRLKDCKKKDGSGTYDCVVTPDYSGKYVKWQMTFEN